jgi:hypothetical protein
MDTTYCKHLRTKSMYVGAAQEEAFAEKKGEFVTPTHFWCNRTQTVIGVDDRPAHKSACNSLRSCCEQ